MYDYQTTDNVQIQSFRIVNELSVYGSGDRQTFYIGYTKAAQSHGSVLIHWYNPTKPLILVIETPYTKQRKPFSVIFGDPRLNDASDTRSDGDDSKEQEPESAPGEMKYRSDSHYRVIVEFKGSSETPYGTDFSIEERLFN